MCVQMSMCQGISKLFDAWLLARGELDISFVEPHPEAESGREVEAGGAMEG